MIRGIRSATMGVTNLDVAADFFERIWGIAPVTRTESSASFRGTGSYHHILELQTVPRTRSIRITFDVVDRQSVGALFQRVQASGVLSEAPGRVKSPGGGYGFGCLDPEGRALAFVAEADDHTPLPSEQNKVIKIAHVNLNCADADASAQFYIDVLGFTLIDQAAYRFLHCDSTDHSAIILAPNSASTLNHIAFEMENAEAVMRGAGRMEDHGYPIEWGVGRHGPSDNIFAYFAGPEEMPIEYTTEVLQVDESYEPHGPEYWKYPAGRTDLWGVTKPRSRRFARVQTLFPYGLDDYRIRA
jgi:catechol 2,3-dioxygenase-like lactoylglutathione lyase family enzyme